MKEAKLVRHLLKKRGIVLPTKLFKEDVVIGLEKAFSSGNPVIISQFFNKVAKELDKYFNDDALEYFESMNKFLRSKYGNTITGDDRRIIDFLVSISEDQVDDYLRLFGPIVYMYEITETLEERRDIPKNIIAAVLMWLFVNLYELTLTRLDRHVYYHLLALQGAGSERELLNNKWIKQFMQLPNRREGKHANANLLNKTICQLLNLPENNSSIFGKSSEPKIIRNEISHTNLFYDSEKNIIVTLDGMEYTLENFLFQYYQIYSFLLEWMKRLAGPRMEDVKTKLKIYLNSLSRVFLKIERSGYRKHVYEVIIEWKKEAK
ncbi:MAG: hypothetical protein J7L10_01995 [Methanomicrobia archaeon]|nr:hypothetical protein [Methanomicrobia archaeon]